MSVIIRTENLSAPAGRHHEWLTGHVLSTISIFEKNGVAQHYFSPVITFNAKAEQNLIKQQTFRDKNYYAYYTSYPPFCFIFPYLIFKATGFKVSLIGIRIISLLIHLGCGLLIFFIINLMFKKNISSDIFLPAIIGFTSYTFAAGNLWFHANVYFADMLVHVFILLSIYLLIKIIEEPEKNVGKRALLLIVITFFGVYTEYLALFVAFFTGAFFFILFFRKKVFLKYILVLAIASVSALGLTVFQYTQIAGFEELKQKTTEKYAQRSGHNKEQAEAGFSFGTSVSTNRFFSHYETNYKDLLDYVWLTFYIVAFLLLAFLFHQRIKIEPSHLIAFGTIFLSICVHHLVFFNFTVVHDFSTLKSSILFTLFIGYTIGLLFQYFSSQALLLNTTFILITGWFVHKSLNSYYATNQQDKGSHYQKIIGQTVKQYSTEEEVIFTNIFTTPVIWWYGQRGILEINSVEGCQSFLKFSNSPKG
ncbi:MAG TPA: hypothetical protein PLC65_02880, partial [Bacteroidia bacterium]|nr:hypothetical protein [Bacteroidia bacterium]